MPTREQIREGIVAVLHAASKPLFAREVKLKLGKLGIDAEHAEIQSVVEGELSDRVRRFGSGLWALKKTGKPFVPKPKSQNQETRLKSRTPAKPQTTGEISSASEPSRTSGLSSQMTRQASDVNDAWGSDQSSEKTGERKSPGTGHNRSKNGPLTGEQIGEGILAVLRSASKPLFLREIKLKLGKLGIDAGHAEIQSVIEGELSDRVSRFGRRLWALKTFGKPSVTKSKSQNQEIEPKPGTFAKPQTIGESSSASEPFKNSGLPSRVMEQASDVYDALGYGHSSEQVEELAQLLSLLMRAHGAPCLPRTLIRQANRVAKHHLHIPEQLLLRACAHAKEKRWVQWDGKLLAPSTIGGNAQEDKPGPAARSSRYPQKKGGGAGAPYQPTLPTRGHSEQREKGSEIVSSGESKTAITSVIDQIFSTKATIGESAATKHTKAIIGEAAGPKQTNATIGLSVPAAPGQTSFGARPKPDEMMDLAELEPEMVLNDKYKLVALAGAGGMGQVWEAQRVDSTLQIEPVAIKTVRTGSGRLAEALRQELVLLKTLRRPEFFPTIYDDFLVNQQHFVVMDWVNGETLKEYVCPHAERNIVTSLDRPAFMRIMEQIADRLAYLHTWPQGEIIFRDLKPSNIMIDPDTQHVRLVDFGISHFADPEGKDTVYAGTSGYLAPEVHGNNVTVKTDIFAFGRVGLFLLFGHENFEDIRGNETPPMCYEREFNSRFVEACRTLCHPNPAERPDDPHQALDILRRALQEDDSTPNNVLRGREYGCENCDAMLLRDAFFCVRCGHIRKPVPESRPRFQPSHQFQFSSRNGEDIEYKKRESREIDEVYSSLLEVRAASDLSTLQCLPHIDVQPYDYQREAVVQILSQLNGRAMIADDVGLGKTIEAGMIIKEYLERGLARSCLLVAPPGLLLQQLREELLQKFRLNFKEFRGSGDYDGDPDTIGRKSVKNVDLLAVSLNTFRRDENAEALRSRNWDILVVDECHHVKNRRTKTYKAIRNMVTPYVIFMSATPFSGKTEELWTVYSALSPGLLGASIREFNRDFLDGDEPNDELKKLIKKMTIRRRRQDLTIAFPGRSAVRVGVKLTEPQRKFHDAIQEEIRQTRPGGFVLAMRLRQLSSSYESLAESSDLQISRNLREYLSGLRDTEHPKARVFLHEVVPRFPEQEKFLVFSRFRASQKSLISMLNNHGIPTLGLIDSNPSKRPAIIRQFREDESIRALVCGEGAGEGLNLQFCSLLVNYDLPWNPMKVEQRIGRVQRLGQERRKVSVINLTLEDTIEDRVLEILTEKLEMFQLFMGETEQILGTVLKDEGIQFEQWIAAALLPDGRIDEGKLSKFGDELAVAAMKIRIDRELHGGMSDDLIGTVGPRGDDAGLHEPEKPELDLDELEGNW